MLTGLIFSKDRACQLDLLLRSIEDNFTEYPKVPILYLATSEDFEVGYKKLMNMYPDYYWIKETNFFKDTQDIFRDFSEEFMLNFVDDEIITRDFSIKPALEILRNPEVHCISLRLAPHMDYCYTADSPDPQPYFDKITIDGQNVFKWNWRENWRDASDWHYPSCINSHIYKVDDFKKYVSQLQYPYPNPLEGYYNNLRDQFRPCNLCFEQSKSVNIANNLVQLGRNRYSEKPEFHQINLNKEFLNGRRLDPKPFYNIENEWATFPKDYVWEN